ncbi:MAG: hypothetical protein ACRDMV_25190 [Streptosporangiales bacterium]
MSRRLVQADRMTADHLPVIDGQPRFLVDITRLDGDVVLHYVDDTDLVQEIQIWRTELVPCVPRAEVTS